MMTSSHPFVVNILLFWAIATVVSVVESRQQLNQASDAAPYNDQASSSLTRSRRDASEQQTDDSMAAFDAEVKRFGASRTDAIGKQKLAFRSDLGRKRSAQVPARHYAAFRTDFGKREQPSKSSILTAAKENWKRYNSFRSDLGKRYSSFRSDLGKRYGELNDDDDNNEYETEMMAGDDVKLDKVDAVSNNAEGGGVMKRYASFRSDLGKRRIAPNMQAFRSDLGK